MSSSNKPARRSMRQRESGRAVQKSDPNSVDLPCGNKYHQQKLEELAMTYLREEDGWTVEQSYESYKSRSFLVYYHVTKFIYQLSINDQNNIGNKLMDDFCTGKSEGMFRYVNPDGVTVTAYSCKYALENIPLLFPGYNHDKFVEKFVDEYPIDMQALITTEPSMPPPTGSPDAVVPPIETVVAGTNPKVQVPEEVPTNTEVEPDNGGIFYGNSPTKDPVFEQNQSRKQAKPKRSAVGMHTAQGAILSAEDLLVEINKSGGIPKTPRFEKVGATLKKRNQAIKVTEKEKQMNRLSRNQNQ
mmetsp:Transcript_9685/g.12651  ORF Transcript_9685/g.12651 Transcript_9685/m.12651 type:complete len:300 (+) Transcript_9685:240-1139(+)